MGTDERTNADLNADYRRRHYRLCAKPDWRWTAAVARCQAHQRARTSDDPLIGPAIHYLNRAARHGPQAAGKTWPVLHTAFEIHRSAGALRDEIEARLLTGVTVEEVAEKTGVSVPVVEAYESYFFNVAGRLEARDWVMLYAVDLSRGPIPPDGKIWKYLAVAGGPVVLDIMVDDFHNRPDADIAGRSLLARKGRFLVRQITADWTDRATAQALVREGSELFPEASDWLKFRALLSRRDPLKVRGKRNEAVRPAGKRQKRSDMLDQKGADLSSNISPAETAEVGGRKTSRRRPRPAEAPSLEPVREPVAML